MYHSTEVHVSDENIIVDYVLWEHVHLEPVETDSGGDSNHGRIFF